MRRQIEGFGGRLLVVLAIVAAGLATVPISPSPAAAALAGMPAGFVDEVVVGGLPYPTAIAFTPDDTMFIALKEGIVRVRRNGQLLATPFIDISARVHDNHDRGLLSITAHPEFPLQPYVYLLYTHDPAGVYPDGLDPAIPGAASTPARTAQLLRVEADPATNYATAKAGTETVLLGAGGTRATIGRENDGRNTASATCMNPKTPTGTPVRDCIASDENSHTIGTVAFAPDGSLFITSGDGSNYGGTDPRALRSQNLDSLQGKVIRIDPVTGNGMPDNPFFDGADPGSNRSKVWALGLRNPFRFAVNPATGDPFVGDVGWGTWEEINTGKGANFGWPCYEGGSTGVQGGTTTSLEQGSYKSNGSTSATCASLYAQGLGAVRAPVFAYDHSIGGSTSGGAFYVGSTYPAQYRNAMFIGDYSNRWIRYLTFDAQGRASVSNFGTDPSTGPVQLISGPDTNIYWMRYDDNGGEVRRIRYVGAGNTPPVAAPTASPTIGIAPLSVSFNSDQSYDPDAQPLSYAWNFGDGATGNVANPTHVYTQSGVYDATLTLTEQTAPFASTTAAVRITVGSNPPLATIETPTEGAGYKVGDTIAFSATASAGGTPMPASSMTWQLRHHHNQHIHYSALPSAADPGNPNRSQGAFVADDHGDTVFYEVCVTATVSPEVTDNRCVNLTPQTVEYTLLTEPTGLQLNYEDEGTTVSSPAIVRPVVGSSQTVSVEPIQHHLSFVRWSDGLTERSRTFTVGATPQTFTAVYENKLPTAVITPGAPAGQAPLTVAFDGRGSSDPEGDALTYQWSTSDGQTATGAQPSLTFAPAGTYAVTLTVTDQLGATGITTVNVQATQNQLPPTARFTATPQSGRAPLTVALDGRASTDPEGGALTYAWSSSDGQVASGAQASLTFTQAGSHTVTLTVTDTAQATGTASTTIVVQPPAPPGLVMALGFNEASGSAVTDASGSGNNGTISGATRASAGRYGPALSFDGVNDSVSVADAASLDVTNTMTLSAWVRPATLTSWRTVLLKERPGGLSYAIYSSGDVPRPSGQLVIAGGEYAVESPTGLVVNAWRHLTMTYDGATMRLFVDGVQVATKPQTGNAAVSTGALKIGGNAIWGEWFNGLIDEVRVYNRALTATEIQADMATGIATDAAPPTTPAGLTATPGTGRVTLGWSASSDDVGVTGYDVHRSTTAGFTPSAATLLATVATTGHVDTAVTAGTTYHYRVIAKDGAGNASAPSAPASAAPTADTAAPAVSVTAPAAGATVSGSVNLAANASDNVGVAGVQFKVDGADVGAEDTSSPYGVAWNSATLANGNHAITAVARDAAGNVTTSGSVSVTVNNTVTNGLVLALGLNENAGSAATDASGTGNNATISGATWAAAGRYGPALSFDGVNDFVSVPDAASLDLTNKLTVSAWVRPATVTSWRTVLVKERPGGLSYGMYSSGDLPRPSGQLVIGSAERSAEGPTGLPANTWRHLTFTYDGVSMRLFVDGVEVVNLPQTGNAVVSTGALKIGGNAIWGEWFSGLIDEVRVYNRALSAAEIQADMATGIAVDGAPPSTPAGLVATPGVGKVTLGWSASTDDVGVTGYEVHRSTTAGFTPSPATLLATVTTTGHVDSAVTAGTTYHYRVVAKDGAGKSSAPSAPASATPTADTVAPAVSVTAPAVGATVSGSVNLAATASDNAGVAGVQFKVDGANVGAEDTTVPYGVAWNSATLPNGARSVTAVARDAAGNTTTSSPVSVTVNNTVTNGLVLALGFNEASGTAATDASGSGNNGTISGATRAAGGRYGSALSFDGANDFVSVPDAASLDLTNKLTVSAWVRPATVTSWRTVALKERPGGLSYGLYSSGELPRPSGQLVIGSAERSAESPTGLAVNTWQHLTFTYDGAAMRVFVDGVELVDLPQTGNAVVSTGAVKIGGNAVWGEWFNGLIDDVRIYNRALTVAEIQADMAAGI